MFTLMRHPERNVIYSQERMKLTLAQLLKQFSVIAAKNMIERLVLIDVYLLNNDWPLKVNITEL